MSITCLVKPLAQDPVHAEGSMHVRFFPPSISYPKEAKSTCPFSYQLLQFHKIVMLNTKLPPTEASPTPRKRVESKAVFLINYPRCFLPKLFADRTTDKNRLPFSATGSDITYFLEKIGKRKRLSSIYAIPPGEQTFSFLVGFNF